MTRYLDADTLIAINESFGGGVIDRAGVESAAYRPQSGFGDTEVFPDLWSKAAAYLHGLATTQCFADGNKRTAWTAAMMFLDANGYELPRIPDVDSESFVHAVAQDVFRTDDEPDKTLKIAAEWLQSKWTQRRAGPAQDPRLEYVFLAKAYIADDLGSTFHVQSGGFTGYTIVADDMTAVFPLPVDFVIVGRFHWTAVDPLLNHTITAELVPLPGHKRVNRAKIDHSVQGAIPPSAHPHHQPTGLLPMIFHIGMSPVFVAPSDCTLHLDVDGVRVAELPFSIKFLTTSSTTPDIAGLA